VWALAASPEQAAALVRRRLAPVRPAAAGRVAALAAALDSDRFAERERA
jgi:hypothetical protein